MVVAKKHGFVFVLRERKSAGHIEQMAKTDICTLIIKDIYIGRYFIVEAADLATIDRYTNQSRIKTLCH